MDEKYILVYRLEGDSVEALERLAAELESVAGIEADYIQKPDGDIIPMK